MHTAPDTATYRHVQGLSRGLNILRALNASGPNGASPRQLSEATRLNRTTVKRLLETLVCEGYVLACNCEGNYGLSPEVLALSRGLTDDAHVLCHASPVLKDLAERTGWSLRINTPQTDCVVIRDSSHSYSQLSFEPWGGLNRSLPILLTAAGRAFFANLSDDERQRTVDVLRQRRDEQSKIACDRKLLDQLTRRVLDDGYARNDGDWADRRLGGVGLPIRNREGRVLATMSMLYTRRPVTLQVIDNEFVPALRASVAQVESRL